MRKPIKPRKPTEPDERILVDKQVDTRIEECSSLFDLLEDLKQYGDIEQISKNLNFYMETTYYYNVPYTEIYLRGELDDNKEYTDNPRYKTEYKKYLKKLEEYEKKMLKYQEDVKKYDAHIKEVIELKKLEDIEKAKKLLKSVGITEL